VNINSGSERLNGVSTASQAVTKASATVIGTVKSGQQTLDETGLLLFIYYLLIIIYLQYHWTSVICRCIKQNRRNLIHR
jgi:hypothetical protein